MMPDTLAAFLPTRDCLRQRTVLITGAGQGLGRALALECASHGATVILLGRTLAKLEGAYDDIIAAGHAEPVLMPMDLAKSSDHDFDQMAGTIEAQLGGLTGIVHCAADFTSPAPLEQIRLEAWMQSLRVHLAAPLALTRACARLLRAAPDASVLFTGETHGLHAGAFWGAFAAANAALTHSVHMLALEWAHWPQLRVNLIVPGNIDSPQRARTHPGEHARERKPLAAVLPAYLCLLSDAGRGCSGKVFEL